MEKLAQDLDGNLLHSSIARHDNLEKDPITPIATAVKQKTENTQVHSGEGCHEEAIGENSKGTNRKSLDLVSLKSEDYDTDLDDIETDTTRAELARKEDVDIGHLTYAEACKQLEISPRRVIIQQLRSRDISLQHIGLKTNDAIALSQALMANNRVESIDMEDNGLTEEAIVHLLEALKLNIHISNLCFSENKFNLNSAMKMGEYMHEATYLTHLDLSGTRLGNMGAKQIAYGIRGNVSLVGLNLKNNEIGEVGSQHLGSALSINDTLEVLNLGWNHIRRMGAVAFCRSLQKNTSLVTLDLSWNGLGFEGSICLEEVLKKNKTLKVLDISHNRINWEGIVYLARGLRQNSSLQILKIGNNPISMDGCEKLLRSLNTPISHVIHVGLEDIPVNTGVLNVTRTIGLNRIFSISHGGVLDTKDIMGIRKEKRDDPLSLLIRYLSVMGIRVVDLFRMFESDSHAHVSKESFIKGLKKIGTPLSDRDMRVVARRLDKRGEGFISYSLLANGVRNQIKNERKEDRKQLLLEVKRREERKRILRHGVTGPRNAHLPDVNEMIPPRDSYSRLLSASNTSIGQISSSSRVGFLPRLPEAGSNTPRNLVTMQKGNSVYMPTEKTKTPSSSTSAIASNTIESVETQLEKLSYPLKSENSSPVPSQ